MIVLVKKSLLVFESRVQSFGMFNKCPQAMRMVFEESSQFKISLSNLFSTTFLVQNSVLNKKLSNSFFVIIMYFFTMES